MVSGGLQWDILVVNTYIYFALDDDIIKPLATIYQFGESKEERNIIDCESILKLKRY